MPILYIVLITVFELPPFVTKEPATPPGVIEVNVGL
jgi:hypothetical protein